ncbi:SDR family oxidoreductase [Reyranella sp.]|jgi:NAD(P)-dependent dehydrogenase (short-subunit alcohol dehydrogenase family)|uniref:SDR family NAD(P)-dependent oxidoreductase n=1 Tax=Reyranella sp. TaxID=1929291 RepID=UPI002F95765C
MKRLQGKTALITGASSGIGRAIARKFHAEGAILLLMDITEQVIEGGEPTHELLSVPFFKGDVSKEAAVEEAVRRAAEPTGRLDILVNDSVIRVGKPLVETSLDEWERVMAVNVTGVFLMCRAAVRRMLTQDIRNEARGRIVNISSQHGMIAAPEDCSYGVSKSAVVYLTRQIAADYGKDNIICNAVAPGKILTGKGGRAVEPRWIEYSHARTPLPRLGRSDDVANAALFLASDEATFITGENLMVDGGWMAS